MSRSPDNPPGQYSVGYGRPPVHSRFPKGKSGNPGGRPRGRTPARLSKLVMDELFHPVTVREGDKVFPLPAITAVVRQTVRQALKGSSPAQRKVIEVAQKIAQETAIATDNKAEEMPQNITDADRAQALAVFLARTGMKMVPKND